MGPHQQGVGVTRRDQTLASAAAAAIPEQVTKVIRTRFRALPLMFHSSGLAATIAYLSDKADTKNPIGLAYGRVLDKMIDRLAQQGFLTSPAATPTQVLTRLGSLPPPDYARASADLTEFAVWLKRLAEAKYSQNERDQPAGGGA